MSSDPALHSIPIEDKHTRTPEWQAIERGYGQHPTLNTYEIDLITLKTRQTGPQIAKPKTRRQRNEKPVP
jgi:hypothetical protein